MSGGGAELPTLQHIRIREDASVKTGEAHQIRRTGSRGSTSTEGASGKPNSHVVNTVHNS
jgi:hypothetical protein